MIPDFGESDVLHLNLPLKQILSESLKKGQWPLWTPLLAGGFPILAEGQIGTFYLPNLFAFRFLPTVIAYNLNLALSFFLFGMGMYVLCRKVHLSFLSSLFSAILALLSGYFTVHLNHFNLLQSASLTPWLFFATLSLYQKGSIRYMLFFSFLLSQQIFAGHFYIVFISLIGITILYLSLFIRMKMHKRQKHGLLISGCILVGCILIALALSAIQLFPTLELLSLSARQTGLEFTTVTSFPYPPKHLVTFILPYFFGDPRVGTYPPFRSDWGIFWENTAYLGIIPLIFMFVSLFFLHQGPALLGSLLVWISLLLILGKYSPFYFLFSFPLFNLFRVPSKFLLLTTVGLLLLAAFGFDKVRRKIPLVLQLPIVLIAIIDLWLFSYSYPPKSYSRQWYTSPQTAQIIQQENVWGRIASLGAPKVYNDVFLKTGWKTLAPYLFFKNSLYQNENVLYDLPSLFINTGGITPRRIGFIKSFAESFALDEHYKHATLSAEAKNTLSLWGVRYLVSVAPIPEDNFILLKTISPPDGTDVPPFFLYRNQQAYPRAYIAYNTQEVETVEDVYRELAKQTFLSKKTIFTEGNKLQSLTESIPPRDIHPATIVSETDISLTLSTSSEYDGILVVSDTFYHGWTAKIDEKAVPIFPVNLTQRGISIAGGTHTITFQYTARSFLWGKIVTIVSSIIAFVTLFLFREWNPGKVFQSASPVHYPPNTRFD